MYARRYYRQSPPPGYSGMAFAAEEKNPPNPEKDGAEGGQCRESIKQEEPLNPLLVGGLLRDNTDDQRNEVSTNPRDFSYTGKGWEQDTHVFSESAPEGESETVSVLSEEPSKEHQVNTAGVVHKKEEEHQEKHPLAALFRTRFNLEELLLIGLALLLASGESEDELFLLLAIALVLSSR